MICNKFNLKTNIELLNNILKNGVRVSFDTGLFLVTHTNKTEEDIRIIISNELESYKYLHDEDNLFKDMTIGTPQIDISGLMEEVQAKFGVQIVFDSSNATVDWK